MQKGRRLPQWLRMQRASGENYSKVKHIVIENQLHTICTSGNCPNIGECWNRGTATFMILGDISVSYTHLRAHETGRNLVCRLLLEKKKKNTDSTKKTKADVKTHHKQHTHQSPTAHA